MKLIAAGVGLYLFYCGLMFLFQRQVLFPAGQADRIPGAENKVPYLEKLFIDTPSGKVEAWLMPPEPKDQGRHPVVIFAHGNAELIDYWPEPFVPFTEMGMAVLLVEYPGYGGTEGNPSQQSITEAFVKAHDLIVEHEFIDPKRTVYIGRSIGGGVVCSLARKRKPAAMVLMSTFTSVKAMAKRFFVPGVFVKDPFDNLDFVRSFENPLLVIHGKDDELISHRHGVALAKAAPRGRLITYEAGHNNCPPNWETFYKDVKIFLENSEILKKS